MTGERLRGGLVSEYVSTDCPTGQITLTLTRAGGFTLALAIWDPVVRDHVGWRTLSGNWNVDADRLTLSSRARELTYGLGPLESAAARGPRIVPVLRWERSSLPTFADGFDLVARR